MTTEPSISRVLVPVDGSAPSHKAVILGARFSRLLSAEMTLLYVGPLSEHPLLVAEAEAAAVDGHGRDVLEQAVALAVALEVEPKTAIRRGHAAEEILRFSRKYRPQLIILGTRGLRGASSVLLGSVSRAVSQNADCSVVLAR